MIERIRTKITVLMHGIENVENTEIRDLREPIKQLLGQMKQGIDQGLYMIIIGEDVSGRVPALIFRDILGELYQKKEFSRPKTVFFAGSTVPAFYEMTQVEKQVALKPKIQEIRNYFAYLLKTRPTDKGKKALIITEMIQDGSSLKPIVQALKLEGIAFDIATISLIYGENSAEESKKQIMLIQQGLQADQIFVGSYAMPSIYVRGSKPGRGDIKGIRHREALHGVEKRGPFQTFSAPLTRSVLAEVTEERERIQKAILSARKDIKVLSRELVAWYLNQSTTNPSY